MVFGGLMEKECSRPALLDKLDRFLDRDQDRALFGLPPGSLAGADRTPPAASASLKSLSKEIVGREMNSKGSDPADLPKQFRISRIPNPLSASI